MIDSEHSGAPAQSEGKTDYEQLRAEALRDAAPLPHDAYAEMAQSIVDGRNYAKRRGATPVELSEQLKDAFVDGEPDPRRARFATMLIDAPYQAWVNGRLNQLKLAVANGERTSANLDTLQELKYRACEYNHLVRDTILDAKGSFSRANLNSWLTAAADNSYPTWAREQIANATSEIALFEALSSMPEVSRPQWTSVPEDLKGVDVKADCGTLGMDFDVKFGDKPTKVEYRGRNHERMHVQIGVPDEAIAELGLSKWGQEYLSRKVASIVAGYRR